MQRKLEMQLIMCNCTVTLHVHAANSATQLDSTQLNSTQLSSAVTMKCHRQHVTLSDDVTCAEAWRPSPATRPVAPAASSSPVHPVTLACASTCVSRSRWAASARADQAAGNPFNTSTNPLDTKLQEILSTPVQTHSAPSCRKSFQHQYKPTRHQAAGNPFNTSTNPLDTKLQEILSTPVQTHSTPTTTISSSSTVRYFHRLTFTKRDFVWFLGQDV